MGERAPTGLGHNNNTYLVGMTEARFGRRCARRVERQGFSREEDQTIINGKDEGDWGADKEVRYNMMTL